MRELTVQARQRAGQRRSRRPEAEAGGTLGEAPPPERDATGRKLRHLGERDGPDELAIGAAVSGRLDEGRLVHLVAEVLSTPLGGRRTTFYATRSAVSLVIPLLLLALTVPLVVALLRANELFCLEVRGKRVRIARGRIPQGLLDQVVDIVGRKPAHATLRAVVEDGRARMYADGELSEAQRQQLRNVLSMWSVPKIRNAPRPR